ncbi:MULTISPECIES: IS3 family transposase [Bacillus]
MHRKLLQLFQVRVFLLILFPYANIYFYNYQRFQKKLNNLSPYKYRTQVA